MNTSSPSITQLTSLPLESPSPSVTPSAVVVTSTIKQLFSQTYSGRSLESMSEDQINGYQVIITLQTQNYGPSGGEPAVTTRCVVNNQELSVSRRILHKLLNLFRRLQQTDSNFEDSLRYLEVDFEMTWTSNHTNVTDPSYVSAFVNYMNSDGGKAVIKDALINLGVAVEEVDNVRLQVQATTPAPSISIAPSITQIPVPTISMQPSIMIIPAPLPTSPNTMSKAVIAIISAVGAIAIIFLAAVIIQRRSQRKTNHVQMMTSVQIPPAHHLSNNYLSHSPSNHSLISEAHSLSSDSLPALNKVATHVIHPTATSIITDLTNNSGGDNVVINPFDDDDILIDDFRWGSVTNDPAEVEVSVLWETHDWLKKQEGSNIEERRLFLMETMNKMLKTVQHDIISDDDATRTIHNCAAMLGLSNVNIAEDIPETALIITGMRKTVTTDDVILSFQEFGDIRHAAVAPKSRGFGLVRFASPKSVQRAMEKFRKEEVVVQDVAVVVRVLSSNMNTIEESEQRGKSITLGTIGPMGNSLGPTQPSSVRHSRDPSSAGSSNSAKSSQRGLPPIPPVN